MIGAIIQARMTSKRFPGKVVANLMGKPVLERVIDRCQRMQCLDKIIVAYPNEEASNPIRQICFDMGVRQYAGPEHDVLSRVTQAAIANDLEYVMRITGDCPFINPLICDAVMFDVVHNKMDYSTNAWPERSFPKGFDVECFTYGTLALADGAAKEEYDREHVTSWIQKCPLIKRSNLIWKDDNGNKIDRTNINLCVDYPEDIKRLETEYPRFMAMMERGNAVLH